MSATDLKRLAAEASVLAGGRHPCGILGHKWKHVGGVNAGCDEYCSCSVPLHQCVGCGDYDYGDNEEADEVKLACANRREHDRR